MTAQLLLLEDVEKLGRSGDIVKVKPGFARNYLLPKGIALVADKRAIRMQEKLKEERMKKAAVDRKDSDEVAKRLEGVTVDATVKVDAEGHMYGSVAIPEIVAQLEAQHHIVLEKSSIQLKHPVKKTGVHTIEVKLKEGVDANFTLKVIPEHAEK